jgi:hypothetical protein
LAAALCRKARPNSLYFPLRRNGKRMSELLSRDPGIHGTAKIFAKNGPLALYLFTAIWLIAWFVYGYGYWEDDAFIHLEFARSLV